MSSFMLYLFLVYVTLTVQAIFFKGMRPDLVLVLVCFYSYKYGQTRGLAYGALAGFLIDTANGLILGPNILSKALTAILIGLVKENVFQWNMLVNAIVVALLSIVDVALVLICLDMFSDISFTGRAWGSSLYQISYTVIAALLLYPIFKPQRIERTWMK